MPLSDHDVLQLAHSRIDKLTAEVAQLRKDLQTVLSNPIIKEPAIVQAKRKIASLNDCTSFRE